MRFTASAHRSKRCGNPRAALIALAVAAAAAAFCPPARANPGSPARFSATVIEPTDKIAWPPRRWTNYMDAIYRSGHDAVIIAWTARNGRSIYPSAINRPFHGLGTEDIVGLILTAADAYGMEAYLGLDGTVDTAEMFHDQYDRPAKRCNDTLDELYARYGRHPSLKGYLIPTLGTGWPKGAERAFYRGVAFNAHRRSPGALLLARVHAPSYRRQGGQGNPALLGIRRYNALLKADYAAVEQEFENDDNFRFWVSCWKKTLIWDGPDVILFEDGLGSKTKFFNLSKFYFKKLREAADASGVKLWAVTEIYGLTRRADDRDPPAAHPAAMADIESRLRMESEFADRIVSFAFDYMDPDSGAGAAAAERAGLHDDYLDYVRMFYPESLRRGVERLPFFQTAAKGKTESPPADDVLYEKALRLEELVHGRHDREGQIITYRDMLHHLDDPSNGWQEDACWLTGIYTAAESFRYAVTKDPDALAYARRGFNALLAMAAVTPKPGIVVRYFNRNLFGFNPVPPEGEKKYWHKDPNREMYYMADISRDQLSGYFIGLAAYYDHVADEKEKVVIRQLIDGIAAPIIENGMKAVEFTGWLTTYGDMTTSPIIGLNMLGIAYHITGKEAYRKKYLELVRYERWLLRSVEGSATTFNHFYEHFDDSSYYHAIQYETDPELAAVMVSGLDFLHVKAFLNGNGHLLADVATYRPWSDAAAMTITELMNMPVDNYYIGEWVAQPPYDYDGAYEPIGRRRMQEYEWCWFPGGNAMQGGPETEFAGIGFLFSYWTGRYHGFIN